MLKFVPKEKMLTVKVTPEVLRDFKIAADQEGGSMSAIVHMFVVRKIREWKEKNPDAFKQNNEYVRPVLKARTSRTKTRAKQGGG